MPRRNRSAWRNDRIRIETHQHSGLVDLNRLRDRRGKRGRRLDIVQRKRAA